MDLSNPVVETRYGRKEACEEGAVVATGIQSLGRKVWCVHCASPVLNSGYCFASFNRGAINMSYNRLLVFPVMALAITVTACAPTPKVAIGPKVSFNWQAPEQCITPASVPVTFAIVQPIWQKVAGSGSMIDAAALQDPKVAAWVKPRKDLFDEFSSSMRNDFFSLMSCKGYTTKGPYASFEEIVFPDRLASDLSLVPEIDLRVVANAEPVEASLSSMVPGLSILKRGVAGTKLKGVGSISGRITLAIRESVTDTRMWTRSIEIPTETFEFVTQNEYPETSKVFFNEVVTGDPAFIQALAPKVAAVYKKALTTAWNFTNSQEMRLVKAQSQDPRRRATSNMSK